MQYSLSFTSCTFCRGVRKPASHVGRVPPRVPLHTPEDEETESLARWLRTSGCTAAADPVGCERQVSCPLRLPCLTTTACISRARNASQGARQLAPLTHASRCLGGGGAGDGPLPGHGGGAGRCCAGASTSAASSCSQAEAAPGPRTTSERTSGAKHSASHQQAAPFLLSPPSGRDSNTIEREAISAHKPRSTWYRSARMPQRPPAVFLVTASQRS